MLRLAVLHHSSTLRCGSVPKLRNAAHYLRNAVPCHALPVPCHPTPYPAPLCLCSA
jgi:hypothetical protein